MGYKHCNRTVADGLLYNVTGRKISAVLRRNRTVGKRSVIGLYMTAT